MTERILYISYDGMLEPLGQSQVLAYLERLAPGRSIHLISFEKPKDWADSHRLETISARIRRAGIQWYPRVWHNRPRIVSAVFNLLVGIVTAIAISVRYRVKIFHARNIFCAAMCLPAVTIRRGKLISDIRGFWPDERVDAGLILSGGFVYRVLKFIERQALRRSAAIVTLTAASVPYLRDDPRFGRPTAPISVIPTCVDLDRFRPPSGSRSSQPFLLGYVGQFGTWYMLDETIALFAALRKVEPHARFLIANRNEHDAIREAMARVAIPNDAFEIRAVDFSQIPEVIGRMTAATCFVRPQFSKISSAPTKFAEYLACGVPIVATAGVGDVTTIIEDNRVGLLAHRLNSEELVDLAQGLVKLRKDPKIRERCRSVAERNFSLEDGVSDYRAIYDKLDAGK